MNDGKATGPRRGWLRRGLWVAAAAVALLLASQIQGDIPLDILKGRYAGGASRFVDVGGLQVHYRDEGEGPPLLLLHGFPQTKLMWRDIAPQLVQSPAFAGEGHQ